MHSSRPCEKNDRLTCTALHWRRVSVGVEQGRQGKATDAAFGFLTPEQWVSVPFVVRAAKCFFTPGHESGTHMPSRLCCAATAIFLFSLLSRNHHHLCLSLA
jgi:hypothetical protein